jgi:hypothetical protein
MMTGDTLTSAPNGRAVITDVWTIAGSGSIRSVVVCDDQPTMLPGLSGWARW